MSMSVKVKAAVLSVISNSILVTFKLIVGFSINSVSIISEAIHSGLDLLAAVLAFIAVSQSTKPPDKEHQFGHGKIENISGIVEALLIFVAALWIIWEASQKITTGSKVETPLAGLIVMGFSSIANLLVSSLLFKTARDTDSIALEADAWHLRTDVYTSLGVACGLGLLWLTRVHIIDPIIAIGVALFIIKASFDLISKAFSPLIDAKLPDDEEEIIRQVLMYYSSYFIGFHKLRTRKSGSERHIDFHLVFPKNHSIVASHELCDEIEREIQSKLGNAHVLIHIEPCRENEDCFSCPDKCAVFISGKEVERNLPVKRE